jgi:hypothetical protein
LWLLNTHHDLDVAVICVDEVPVGDGAIIVCVGAIRLSCSRFRGFARQGMLHGCARGGLVETGTNHGTNNRIGGAPTIDVLCQPVSPVTV